MKTTTLEQSIIIGNRCPATSAQAMIVIGYGDCMSQELPFRNLDFCVQCDSFEDFLECIDLINSYNDFDSDLITKYSPHADRRKYWDEGNANNGRDMFKFYIGRESSPVFYIEYSSFLSPKVKHGNKIEEYMEADFKNDMQCFANKIRCDEFSIKEGFALKARFWFD